MLRRLQIIENCKEEEEEEEENKPSAGKRDGRGFSALRLVLSCGQFLHVFGQYCYW